ncbi:MAG: CBS domain-containing protein [Myxococcales bacterium]|nr:CBS domain-containing protein [Myxococcales bacterium]
MSERIDRWIARTPRPIPTVDVDADVDAMLARLREFAARDLWVVDDEQRYLGHVGYFSLARVALGEHRPIRTRRAIFDRLTGACARDLLDRHIHPARPSDPVDAVIHQMLSERLESLPVVDDERRVIGVLHLDDILADLERE